MRNVVCKICGEAREHGVSACIFLRIVLPGKSGCICLSSLGRGDGGWKARCERRPKSQREILMLEGDRMQHMERCKPTAASTYQAAVGYKSATASPFSGRSNNEGI